MERCIGLEIAASADIGTVTTNATGSNWQTLPSQKCNQVIIYNTSAVTLAVSYILRSLAAGQAAPGAATATQGNAIQIAPGGAQPIRGITNASQVQVQRLDQSNATVTVPFVWESI